MKKQWKWLLVLLLVLSAAGLVWFYGSEKEEPDQPKKDTKTKQSEKKTDTSKLAPLYISEEGGHYVFLRFDSGSDNLKGMLEMVYIEEEGTPVFVHETHDFTVSVKDGVYWMHLDAEEFEDRYRMTQKNDYLFIYTEYGDLESPVFTPTTEQERKDFIDEVKEKVPVQQEHAKKQKDEFLKTVDEAYGYYYSPEGDSWFNLFLKIEKRDNEKVTGFVHFFFDTGNASQPVQEIYFPFTGSLDLPTSPVYDSIDFHINMQENGFSEKSISPEEVTLHHLEGQFFNKGNGIYMQFITTEEHDQIPLSKVTKAELDDKYKDFQNDVKKRYSGK